MIDHFSSLDAKDEEPKLSVPLIGGLYRLQHFQLYPRWKKELEKTLTWKLYIGLSRYAAAEIAGSGGLCLPVEPVQALSFMGNHELRRRLWRDIKRVCEEGDCLNNPEFVEILKTLNVDYKDNHVQFWGDLDGCPFCWPTWDDLPGCYQEYVIEGYSSPDHFPYPEAA